MVSSVNFDLAAGCWKCLNCISYLFTFQLIIRKKRTAGEFRHGKHLEMENFRFFMVQGVKAKQALVH